MVSTWNIPSDSLLYPACTQEYGFVRFQTLEGAVTAVKALDGSVLPNGNRLTVQFSTSALSERQSLNAAGLNHPMGGLGGLASSTHGTLPPPSPALANRAPGVFGGEGGWVGGDGGAMGGGGGMVNAPGTPGGGISGLGGNLRASPLPPLAGGVPRIPSTMRGAAARAGTPGTPLGGLGGGFGMDLTGFEFGGLGSGGSQRSSLDVVNSGGVFDGGAGGIGVHQFNPLAPQHLMPEGGLHTSGGMMGGSSAGMWGTFGQGGAAEAGQGGILGGPWGGVGGGDMGNLGLAAALLQQQPDFSAAAGGEAAQAAAQAAHLQELQYLAHRAQQVHQQQQVAAQQMEGGGGRVSPGFNFPAFGGWSRGLDEGLPGAWDDGRGNFDRAFQSAPANVTRVPSRDSVGGSGGSSRGVSGGANVMGGGFDTAGGNFAGGEGMRGHDGEGSTSMGEWGMEGNGGGGGGGGGYQGRGGEDEGSRLPHGLLPDL